MLEGINPWGQSRLDILFADLAANMYALIGAKKQDGSRFRTSDFLLRFKDKSDDEPVAPQSPDQIEQHLRAWVKASNARFEAREANKKIILTDAWR